MSSSRKCKLPPPHHSALFDAVRNDWFKNARPHRTAGLILNSCICSNTQEGFCSSWSHEHSSKMRVHDIFLTLQLDVISWEQK
jgi:hypothetical protein